MKQILAIGIVSFFLIAGLATSVQALSFDDKIIGFFLNDPVEVINNIFLGDGIYWGVVNGFLNPNVTQSGTDKINASVFNATINITTPKVCLNGDCRTEWPTVSGDELDPHWSGNQSSYVTYSNVSGWDYDASDDQADILADCGGTDKVIGVYDNGTLKCGSDQTGAASSYDLNISDVQDGSGVVEDNQELIFDDSDAWPYYLTVSDQTVSLYNQTKLVIDSETSLWDKNVSNDFIHIANFTGTLTDTKYCIYDLANNEIDCNSEAGGTELDPHWSGNQSLVVFYSNVSGWDYDRTNDLINDTFGRFIIIESTNWTNISITENQISDLQNYLLTELDPHWSGNQSLVVFYSNVSGWDYDRTDDFDASDVWDICENQTAKNLDWNVIRNTTLDDLYQEDLGSDCAADNYVYGVQNDGTLLCRADQTGGGSGDNYWSDGGDYLYPNTTYGDHILSYGYVNASDWRNVSITEGQISDFGSYVTTADWTTHNNYPGACSDGQYVRSIADSLSCYNDFWNTTSDIWNAIDNDTFLKSYTETDPLWAGNKSLVVHYDNVSGWDYDASDDITSELDPHWSGNQSSYVAYSNVSGWDYDRTDDITEELDPHWSGNQSLVVFYSNVSGWDYDRTDDLTAESDPYWSGNQSKVVTLNVTAEGNIILPVDSDYGICWSNCSYRKVNETGSYWNFGSAFMIWNGTHIVGKGG